MGVGYSRVGAKKVTRRGGGGRGRDLDRGTTRAGVWMGLSIGGAGRSARSRYALMLLQHDHGAEFRGEIISERCEWGVRGGVAREEGEPE